MKKILILDACGPQCKYFSKYDDRPGRMCNYLIATFQPTRSVRMPVHREIYGTDFHGPTSDFPAWCPLPNATNKSSGKINHKQSAPEIIESTDPCEYCMGSVNRNQCSACDALTKDCFKGKRLTEPA